MSVKVVDIKLAASRLGKYPPLFTSTSVNNLLIIGGLYRHLHVTTMGLRARAQLYYNNPNDWNSWRMHKSPYRRIYTVVKLMPRQWCLHYIREQYANQHSFVRRNVRSSKVNYRFCSENVTNPRFMRMFFFFTTEDSVSTPPVTILGFKPRDKAAMLVANTIQFFLAKE